MKTTTNDDGPLQVRGGPIPHRHEPRLWRCLLPFLYREGSWQAVPQKPFRPKGLMIWGAPDGATVHCFVGTDLQGVAAWGNVPAKWFATAQSFDQLAAQLDEGKEPPAWVDFDSCEPGVIVTLQITKAGDRCSPADGVELVMWGETFT